MLSSKTSIIGQIVYGICPSYSFDIDEAILTGELVFQGFKQESALFKFKEVEKLLDLLLVEKVNFDIL